MALPLTIGSVIATYCVTAGPFKRGSTYYLIGRHATAGNQMVVIKSTDPQNTWTVSQALTITGAASSNVNTAGSVAAVVDPDGDTLHIVSCWQATTAIQNITRYHKYSMASETFTLSNELIDGPTVNDTGTVAFRTCGIVRRSASVVVALQMPRVTPASSYARVGYRERLDATGVWSAAISLDGYPSTQTTTCLAPFCIKDPQSDRVHFFWYEGASLRRTRTLSAANVLNSPADASTTQVMGHPPYYQISATAFVVGGISKIVSASVGTGGTVLSGVRFDSADNPAIQTISGTLTGGTRPNFARTYYDSASGKLYFIYINNTATDWYYVVSSDNGATFSGNAVFCVGTTSTGADQSFSNNDGQVIVNQNGDRVIAYAYYDNLISKYNEFVLPLPLPSATMVKHSGAWKKPVATHVKHAGTWKPATVHVKSGGVWKQLG